ncbi:winged helix-turn-helix domain-containing protein [Sphingobacterium sp. E70]|uniref:winged helix-turn-helix domain-containing protein n=1 Tax=Sphingobacterium sp. E70 TaxID=2853439 RepID=UPI00211C18D6|nr:winged helix-turn-helix domain-containing protein [Sphingobacterium sp. E70]ULT27141.1 winged helix-turn-helix domain-containing protein [Sphingobacterium sp. E70]
MLRPWNLTMEIDRSSTKAIYLQLADSIAADIQSGRLACGTALPSSRALATQLKLNRNTVVEAIQQLLSEGWVVSQQRRGIFVAQQLPSLLSKAESSTKSPLYPLFRHRCALFSMMVIQTARLLRSTSSDALIGKFSSGVPDGR